MEKPSKKQLFWKALRMDNQKILAYCSLLSLVTLFLFCPDCLIRGKWDIILTIYPYSLIISFALWKGSVMIGFVGDALLGLSWLHRPVQRMVYELLAKSSYTSFTVVLLYHLFFQEWQQRTLTFRDYFDTTFSAFVITTLLTLFFTSRQFLHSWREAAVRAEKLRNESTFARYESLKNQVNPHFLFNSLNALNALIYSDRDMAARFVQQLSEVYRYVLDTQGKEVVPLVDEMAFLESYLFLQQIRYGKNLQVKIDIQPEKDALLPPLSLQLLIENAIKHNIISEEMPLLIDIYEEDRYIIVSNPIQLRHPSILPATQMGLKNLVARYEYLTDRKVSISNNLIDFVVKMPLLNQREIG